MNFKTIDWNDAWKEARAKCNFQERDSAFWNKRAPDFAEISMKTGYAEAFLKIMNPKKNWSIFDMACGAGTLAIPFARHVKSVTAVDFSEKMLEILQEQCIQVGIANVRTVKASWEDNWSKAGIGLHDVAIASRSLVVHDLRHGITKLNNIARKRVYISTIVDDGPHDRHIFEAVGREFNAGPDYIYNYNLLYQMGIYANVNFIVEDNHKTYGNHGEAIDSIRWMLGKITFEEEKKLEDYFDRHLIFNKGRWTMDYDRTVRWAVIWWDKAANIK
ncbi:MAG: methyltransferase domain-containing protein [Proteobacteria bacterium]|nr:methyltransferase domain-containing protein [Pseudomonadota bacterium]